MRLAHPFEVVTPTVDGDVLQVLTGAESSFTVGQLHELVGRRSYNGVKKALVRLVSQGIVSHEVTGTVSTYRLNREHLAAAAVLELGNLRSQFLERLREGLAGWSRPPVFAALFGSAARADMRPDSDIDLFLVRPDDLEGGGPEVSAWGRDVDRLARDATAWTGNDTRVVDMSVAEVRDRVASKDGIVSAVRQEGRILLGDNGFWRRMNRG